jgi:ferric-dicitrate binding protein FerR (iron transport regulator)
MPVDRQFRLRYAGAAAALAGALVASSAASAQSSACTITTYTDPPREVLRCGAGLSITAERGSDYRLIDRDRDGRPEGAELRARGLLIESAPRKGGFQILTPHAIASVRGTIWAADVGPARTSVFVREGSVAVRRRATPEAATLRAGDGIDVESAGPLQVKRWSAERAAHLLARFGR